MSEKKARASVFFVIAIIAFVCSCILFSMTGGVSDWIGDIGLNDTENATDELGLNEFLNQTDSSDDNSDDEDSSKFLDDLTKKDKKSYSNSSSSGSGSDSGRSDSGRSDSDKPSPENPDSEEDSTKGPIKRLTQ